MTSCGCERSCFFGGPQKSQRLSRSWLLLGLSAVIASAGVVGDSTAVAIGVGWLPGVAIAISLVPPLTVVGLTLESGAHDQALGALLLFVSNVSAILVTGLLLMVLYRVVRVADQDLS